MDEISRLEQFYLFVDEAHSIGALGPHGRGVVDYFGVNPRLVDILMGTFTKSFGAVMASMASIMGVAPSTPSGLELAQHHPGPAHPSQLPAWMDLPLSLRDGSEGSMRLRRLAFNARYLSRGLAKLGFITYGHLDSPIVPLLLFGPGKMCAFHRMMLARKTPIVVVVVSYPATPLVTGRARFCVSASHTKDDIDTVLRACDEIGDILDVRHLPGERWSLERVMNSAIELVNMEDE